MPLSTKKTVHESRRQARSVEVRKSARPRQPCQNDFHLRLKPGVHALRRATLRAKRQRPRHVFFFKSVKSIGRHDRAVARSVSSLAGASKLPEGGRRQDQERQGKNLLQSSCCREGFW